MNRNEILEKLKEKLFLLKEALSLDGILVFYLKVRIRLLEK